MAAPTYFGSASNPADNGTGGDNSVAAITPPASMVAGDLVVITTGIRLINPTAPSISETGGQTWTGPLDITGGNVVDAAVFWCQYNGTWSADPSIAFPQLAGTVPCSAVMHVFRPATAGTWTIDTAIAGGTEASASPQVISGITPNNADNVTLACWLTSGALTWGTLAGSGWAVTGLEQYRNTTGSDITLTFAHQLQGTPAPTNDVSKVPSTATGGVSFTIAWYVIGSGATQINAALNESVAVADLIAARESYRAQFGENLEV